MPRKSHEEGKQAKPKEEDRKEKFAKEEKRDVRGQREKPQEASPPKKAPQRERAAEDVGSGDKHYRDYQYKAYGAREDRHKQEHCKYCGHSLERSRSRDKQQRENKPNDRDENRVGYQRHEGHGRDYLYENCYWCDFGRRGDYEKAKNYYHHRDYRPREGFLGEHRRDEGKNYHDKSDGETNFESGSGKPFDEDFYARRDDRQPKDDRKLNKPGRKDERSKGRENEAKSPRDQDRDGHYRRYHDNDRNRDNYDEYRLKYKYYSPYRLQQYGGGEHHHRHQYEYRRFADEGEYDPYNRYRNRREFQRARSGGSKGYADNVNYDHSRSPHKKYFQFDDRRDDKRNDKRDDRRDYDKDDRRDDRKDDRRDNRYEDERRDPRSKHQKDELRKKNRDEREERKRGYQRDDEQEYPDKSRLDPNLEGKDKQINKILKEDMQQREGQDDDKKKDERRRE